MLSIKDFDALPVDEKLSYAWEACDFLMRRSQGFAITVDLYHSDGFFVEVWTSQDHPNSPYVRSLNSFRSVEPYLQEIHIRKALAEVSLRYEN